MLTTRYSYIDVFFTQQRNLWYISLGHQTTRRIAISLNNLLKERRREILALAACPARSSSATRDGGERPRDILEVIKRIERYVAGGTAALGTNFPRPI